MAKYCLSYDTLSEFTNDLNNINSSLYNLMRDVTVDNPSIAVSCYIKDSGETRICGTNIINKGFKSAAHGDVIYYNTNTKSFYVCKNNDCMLCNNDVLVANGYVRGGCILSNDGFRVQVVYSLIKADKITDTANPGFKNYLIPCEIPKTNKVDATTGEKCDWIRVDKSLRLNKDWEKCVEDGIVVVFGIGTDQVRLNPFNYRNSASVLYNDMIRPHFDYTKKDSAIQDGFVNTNLMYNINSEYYGDDTILSIVKNKEIQNFPYTKKSMYIGNIVDVCSSYDLFSRFGVNDDDVVVSSSLVNRTGSNNEEYLLTINGEGYMGYTTPNATNSQKCVLVMFDIYYL